MHDAKKTWSLTILRYTIEELSVTEEVFSEASTKGSQDLLEGEGEDGGLR